MRDGIVVRGGVVVPATAITFAAVRSSGPGGQNVNKVASKVELRVDLSAVTGLDESARERLLALVKNQLDADGHLLVVSQKTRDQLQNLEDAREKVRDVIARALVAPIKRRKTKPSRGAVQRRIDEKKRTGAIKQSRRRHDD